MNTTQAPVFGCPKCAAPNPRDDQLCLECMRAKLSYMNALAVSGYPGGAPVQAPPPPGMPVEGALPDSAIHQPMAYFQPATGPIPNVPPPPAPKARVSPLALLTRVSPGWFFVIAFVIFFMMSGRRMMPSSFEPSRRAPSAAAEYAGKNDEQPGPRHRAARELQSNLERLVHPARSPR